MVGIFSEDVWAGTGQPMDDTTSLFRDWFDAEGIRAWVLHPGMFDDLGRALEWNEKFAADVVQPILRVIQRRRTMNTRLVLPDKSADFPGAAIPPHRIVQHEVAYANPRERDDFEEIMDVALSGIVGAAGDNLMLSQEGNVIGDPGGAGRADMAAFRKAQLCSYDLHNDVLTKIREVNDEFAGRVARRDLKKFVKLPAKTSIAGGVSHVEELIKTDCSGGVNYLARFADPDTDHPLPTDRASMLRLLLARSPAGVALLDGVYRTVQVEKERALVVCDMPWIHA